jgi:O-glycosyl hydrolase
MRRNALLGLFLMILLVWFSGPLVRAEEKVYIDLTIEHQTMDGTAGNIYSDALGYHENVMKLITSDLNLTHVQVRAWLVDGNGENGWEPQNDNGDSSNINWSAFKDEGDVHTDFMMMKELSKAGIKPALGVFDVPDWMVTDPSAYVYRHIPNHMYPEYAEFVVSFLLYAKSEYDVDIKIVQIQNEPNIGWRVYYSPEELADITEVLLDTLDAYGLSHVKLHVGNVNKPTAAISYWEASLKRPAIAARAAAASYHTWEDMTKGVVEKLKVYCHDQCVQCWATEVGCGTLGSHTWAYGAGSMRKHYQAINWSDASMTFQWTLAGAEGSIGPCGEPYPVYHLIKHFYQHIKPGSVRVDAVDDSGTLTTAFLNKSDKTL